MKSDWSRYWQNLLPRERWIMAGGGGVLLVALLYAYFWLPLHQQRQKLQEILPRMRLQATQLQTARDEVLRLKTQVGTGAQSNLPLQQRLTASATAQGLTLLKVDMTGEQSAVLVLDDVAFDEGLRWLHVLQTQQGLRLVAGDITRNAQVGRVNIHATVSQE
ncbi:MAG: type II secretion system protein M [Gallionella sp.]